MNLSLSNVRRQVRIVAVTTAIFTAIFVLAFKQPVGSTLLYCASITICCWVLMQSARVLLCKLLHRENLGWLLVIPMLVCVTPLGYTAGTWFADSILGVHTPTLLEIDARSVLFLLLMSLLPGVAIAYYLSSQAQLAKAKAQAAEQQLRALQAQLEPHMLFNTLANLRALITLDPPRALTMLDQLISFLRATLQASRTGTHSLADEFARLADYLALMQVRMQDRLRPVLDLPPELANAQVPPMLLQPLVENAIKHGLEPSIEGGELRISARREGSKLLLEVADSGVGLSDAPSTGTQFGLHQIRERLATSHGANANLTLTANPQGGAIATITLPLP
ncbi:MAG TPA: histidine kinase [Burkholderiaceae bacterium]|jgi:LytS/YehU family sensor histidine kinase